MLRILLRHLHVLHTEWEEAYPFVSVVVGLLMGFGLLLLAQFSNFSLNGTTITLKGITDTQRIGTMLSPLLFFASLFLEEAWSRLSQKGRKYLEKS
jgi:hypothetical protein